MDLKELLEVSQRYGRDEEMVCAGGGNTSRKDAQVMYVKASGTTLADIDESGFVKMDMNSLQRIWEKEYPEDKDLREEQVLQDMMDARCEGEAARPSVEALLHSFIEREYVVHLHPALVNGVTCSQDGEKVIAELFGEKAVWIPLVNPGYILAKIVRDAVLGHVKKTGIYPQLIFLQNHGVFVSGDSIQEIDDQYDMLMSAIAAKLVRKPELEPVAVDQDRLAVITDAVHLLYGEAAKVYELYNEELKGRLADVTSSSSISSAFTPDHIVYSGFRPCWIDEEVFGMSDPAEEILKAGKAYEKQYGVQPKCLLIQNTGVFAPAQRAVLLFQDTVKVAAYCESFGGPRFMDDDQIDFIRTWEVEKYRASQNS